MSHAGYRLKQQTRDTAPTVLVTVGVGVSEGSFRDGTGARPHVHASTHICIRRRARGRWGPMRELQSLTVPGFWDQLDSLGMRGRRPYVVFGRASDALTVLRWWERVEAGEVVVWPRNGEEWQTDPTTGRRRRVQRHPIVINGKPDILGHSVGGCPFRFVSVSNWCDTGPRAMAAQVGYPVPADADDLDSWECLAWPPQDQARMMMAYMTQLTDWWLSIGGGNWKDTPGAAAWSTYLRRGGENGIIRHIETDALKLEDSAVFGGRATTFFYGNVGTAEQWTGCPSPPFRSSYTRQMPGPIHRFDVRAMYPSLLGSEVYPIRLIRHAGRLDVSELAQMCRKLCVVARVLVQSDRGELPRKGDKGTEYPTGQWWTTLTTPELITALEHKEIAACTEATIYQPGRPFEQWSNWILGLREGMRIKGDRNGELLVKVIANSFGGRLGRKRQGWVDSPHTVPRQWWGQWYECDPDTGEAKMYRSLACHVQSMERDDFRPGTLGAAYAHLTAYGRSMMAKIRHRLIREDVLWQDTDGIMVTDRGAEMLRQLPEYHETRYGAIRYERSFSVGRFLTAKHYWLDGRWVLAGIHDGFSVDDGMCSSEVLCVNPVRSANRPDNAGIFQMVRHIDLSAIDPGTEVDERGWSVPPKRWWGLNPRKRSGGQTPPLPVEQE